MDNVKKNMARKKKTTHILCYFGLVVLVVLLFLPAVLKLVVKEKPIKKEDIVIILTCQKGNEMIKATFQNNEPRNVLYTMPGNSVKPNEEANNENIETTANDILNKFLNYSSIQYNDKDNTSYVQFSVNSTTGTADYISIFNSLTSQETYYVSQGFSCSRSVLK